MTDYKNIKNKNKSSSRRNRFFTRPNAKNYAVNENASGLASKYLESDTVVQAHKKFSTTFRPDIYAKKPESFSYFGSAEKYYNDAAYNIINFYPFDGTQEEVISGSTRLKAGTAQKICLNIISSMVMMKMGRVKNGIMSHMVPTNEKLRNRKLRLDK